MVMADPSDLGHGKKIIFMTVKSCNKYYVGDSTFAAHNSLVHSVDLLKDENLTSSDICDIKYGPETLIKTDLLERICVKEQKEKEEARRRRREKLEKEKLDKNE